jgi:Zn-dependent protease with chaperone function
MLSNYGTNKIIWQRGTLLLTDRIYLIVAIAVLLLPLAAAGWFRHLTLESPGTHQPTQWIAYRRRMRLLTILAVPAWWSVVSEPAVHHLTSGLPTWLLLLAPFSGANLLAQFVALRSDVSFLGNRWSAIDITRLAAWSTASFTLPLLLVAAGLESAYHGSLLGLLWMICAGTLALIGTVRLRTAQGMKPRAVKSGELHKRALVLAKRMGVNLREVCVVPFGKGRLTNAYGSSGMIAVTDDYGHWLHGPELDFVIGHELAHAKHKHGRKKLLAIAGTFAMLAAVAWALPQLPAGGRVLLRFAAIVLPLAACNFLSRQFEYAADRVAVKLTGDGEVAIRSLLNLYLRTETPPGNGRWEGLFATHPSLWERIDAIAQVCQIPGERVSKLKQSGACAPERAGAAHAGDIV